MKKLLKIDKEKLELVIKKLDLSLQKKQIFLFQKKSSQNIRIVTRHFFINVTNKFVPICQLTLLLLSPLSSALCSPCSLLLLLFLSFHLFTFICKIWPKNDKKSYFWCKKRNTSCATPTTYVNRNNNLLSVKFI